MSAAVESTPQPVATSAVAASLADGRFGVKAARDNDTPFSSLLSDTGADATAASPPRAGAPAGADGARGSKPSKTGAPPSLEKAPRSSAVGTVSITAALATEAQSTLAAAGGNADDTAADADDEAVAQKDKPDSAPVALAIDPPPGLDPNGINPAIAAPAPVPIAQNQPAQSAGSAGAGGAAAIGGLDPTKGAAGPSAPPGAPEEQGAASPSTATPADQAVGAQPKTHPAAAPPRLNANAAGPTAGAANAPVDLDAADDQGAEPPSQPSATAAVAASAPPATTPADAATQAVAAAQASTVPTIAGRTWASRAPEVSSADRFRGLAKSGATGGGSATDKLAAAPTPIAETAKIGAIAPPAALTAAISPAAAEPDEPEVSSASDGASSTGQPAVQASAPPLPDAGATNAAPAPAEVRGSPDTVASFAAELVRRFDQQSSRFQVTLNPGGLGRVDVSLKIGSDGALSADIDCDTPAGAAALKARSGELTTALGQAGFTLSPGALRIDAPLWAGAGSTGGAAFADAQANDGGNGQGRPQPPAAWRNAEADLDLAADLPAYASSRIRGLDIRI